MKRISTQYAGTVGELLEAMQKLDPDLSVDIGGETVEIIHWKLEISAPFVGHQAHVELIAFDADDVEVSYGT